MKFLLLCAAAILLFAVPAFSLDGEIQIHDPSTIIQCEGKFYVYGTGLRALTSDDGWKWKQGTSPGRGQGGGLAPDVVHIGDCYFFYYGEGAQQPKAAVHMMSNKTLNPDSPDYKWEDGGIVASSDGFEDCNAIDPGVMLDPNDGRLWLSYGSYFGYIRIIELDPKSGKRLHPDRAPVNVAINCEASDMMYHDGWYYLLADHGSCCVGADSGYNIRVGRSKSLTGPYLDDEGINMIQGGGKLFLGSSGRHVGPGHFGLIDRGDGVQWFSCHYEADFDRGNASVLDIRPLLWKDGWPVAGENFKDGTYEIESVRTGTALEMAVEGVPVGGARTRRRRGAGGAAGGGGFMGRPAGGNATTQPTAAGAEPQRSVASTGPTSRPAGGMFAGTGSVIPTQDATQVSANWPGGDVPVRLANYLVQAQQKWTITAIPKSGGYLGSPYYKIQIAGTDRTLATTEDDELVVLPTFNSGTEQLWRIEQMTDGNWRILPKAAFTTTDPAKRMALTAIGASSATLEKLNAASTRHRWSLKAP